MRRNRNHQQPYGNVLTPDFWSDWIHFSPDDESGNGGEADDPPPAGNNGGDGQPGGNGAQGGSSILPDEALAALERLTRREGGSDAVAELLYNDNRQLRERLRNAEGRVPAEGDVVLTGDDAERWRRYRGLGTPDELETMQTEREQFQGELADVRKAQTVRAAADLYDYEPTVLQEIADDLTLEIRIEGEGATAREAAYVIEADGDEETETLLPDWIEANKAAFKPALERDRRDAPRGNRPDPRPAGQGNLNQERENREIQRRQVQRAF